MKISVKKILCPLDFSDCAKHAVTYAMALAEQFEADLELMYVVEPPVTAIPVGAPPSTLSIEYMTELKTYCDSAMQEEVERLRGEWPRVDYCIVSGTPYLEIVNKAHELDVDLVVLGTHGRSGVAHVMMGSVAEKVVRKAPCPVLTVKHPEHEFVTPD